MPSIKIKISWLLKPGLSAPCSLYLGLADQQSGSESLYTFLNTFFSQSLQPIPSLIHSTHPSGLACHSGRVSLATQHMNFSFIVPPGTLCPYTHMSMMMLCVSPHPNSNPASLPCPQLYCCTSKGLVMLCDACVQNTAEWKWTMVLCTYSCLKGRRLLMH